MKHYAFVSYSREDVAVITPIVRLIRTAIAGVPSVSGHEWELVFQDIDHIAPGTLWRDAIGDALARAARVFVFWCHHSARSVEVQKEYRRALDLGKVVVPILIDDTPLSELLIDRKSVV